MVVVQGRFTLCKSLECMKTKLHMAKFRSCNNISKCGFYSQKRRKKISYKWKFYKISYNMEKS